MPKIGNAEIELTAGELSIKKGLEINIPLHSVKMMLGLYKFKDIKDKEIRTFDSGEMGWISFAEELSTIYVDKFGNKITPENIKSLGNILGITQADIKRAMLISSGEDFSNKKWVDSAPSKLVFDVIRKVPVLKVLKNKKIKNNHISMKFFEENPVVKRSMSGKKLDFGSIIDTEPIYKSMLGDFMFLREAYGVGSFKALINNLKSKKTTPDEIINAYNIISYGDSVLFEKLIEDVGVPPDIYTLGKDKIKAYESMHLFTKGSTQINGFLKGYDNHPDDVLLDDIKNLDKAFEYWGFNMDKNAVLYRGQNMPADKYKSLVDGSVLPFNGYTSFSISMKTAAGFSNFNIGYAFKDQDNKEIGTTFESDSGYYFVLFVVKGFDKVLCLLPGKHSKYPNEKEIIVNRGMGLKILRKINTTNSYSVIIECEVVTDDVQSLSEETNMSVVSEDMIDMLDLINTLDNTPVGKEKQAVDIQNSNEDKWKDFIDFELFE